MATIKCFGITKDIIGKSELHITLATAMSVSQLRERINGDYADLSSLSRYMIAVNQEYATDELIVYDQDEIAIIPPVSGG